MHNTTPVYRHWLILLKNTQIVLKDHKFLIYTIISLIMTVIDLLAIMYLLL